MSTKLLVDTCTLSPTKSAVAVDAGANTVPSSRRKSWRPANAATVPTTWTATALDRTPQTDQRLHVESDGQDYQLVVTVALGQPGHVYVRPLIGGPRRLVLASTVKLLGFVGSRGLCQSD